MFALASAVASTAIFAGASGSLDGRWNLVHQAYENGQANLMAGDRAIELSVADGVVTVRSSLAAGLPPLAWPAFADRDGRPVRAEVASRTVDDANGTLFARYVAWPDPESGVSLTIEESYALDPVTDELRGTVTVGVDRDGERRGGYVLHRRFERVAP